MRRMKWISVFIGKYLCANWVVIHSSALQHTFKPPWKQNGIGKQQKKNEERWETGM